MSFINKINNDLIVLAFTYVFQGRNSTVLKCGILQVRTFSVSTCLSAVCTANDLVEKTGFQPQVEK